MARCFSKRGKSLHPFVLESGLVSNFHGSGHCLGLLEQTDNYMDMEV